MSKMEEYEEEYSWVHDALLEEFPDGEVIYHTTNYGHDFIVALMAYLPNGVLWRQYTTCVREGVPMIYEGKIAKQNIKDAFRSSYQRACDEQQTSGS